MSSNTNVVQSDLLRVSRDDIIRKLLHYYVMSRHLQDISFPTSVSIMHHT